MGEDDRTNSLVLVTLLLNGSQSLKMLLPGNMLRLGKNGHENGHVEESVPVLTMNGDDVVVSLADAAHRIPEQAR